ncbi:MAG: YidH family protein [Anaerolineae bacterium]
MNDRSERTQIEQDDLAKTRTDLARERTIMADERTFSAWIRTGLAAEATGLGIMRLLDPTRQTWEVQALGILLILTSAGIYVTALLRHRAVQSSLRSEGITTTTPDALLNLLTAALLLSTMLALVVPLRM